LNSHAADFDRPPQKLNTTNTQPAENQKSAGFFYWREKINMTKQEQEIWQAIAESGGDGWTEDTVFRLTGRGALYHWGDSDGRYISVSDSGLLSVDSFNEAFPHMGKAFFTPEWSRQYAGFDKAMDAVRELGGERFWDAVYSPEIGEYDGLPLKSAPPEAFRVNFYCPLTVMTAEDDVSSYVETDVGILGCYEDRIRAAIENDIKRGGDTDLAEYFHGSPSLQSKLVSVQFDVENIRNEIFGCVHVDTTEPLTDEEKEEIRDFCTGQASDGFGEGFEQRPIKTEDGNLHISFWDSDEDWFLLDDDEFEAHLGGQYMGGIE
jgi:hypothetical protein